MPVCQAFYFIKEFLKSRSYNNNVSTSSFMVSKIVSRNENMSFRKEGINIMMLRNIQDGDSVK